MGTAAEQVPSLPISRFSLPPILVLGLCQRLPLHVGGIIRPATLQGNAVIDHIAGTGARCGAGRWTGVAGLERAPGVGSSADATVCVPLARFAEFGIALLTR